MSIMCRGLLAATALLAPFAASAATVVSGNFNGTTWTAQSRIVGVTSTATVAAGGDPRYLATAQKYSGVAALIMTYNGVGSFICTGSLMSDRQSILTAGHCVTNGPSLARPDKVTAYFYGGGQDVVVPARDANGNPTTPGVVAIDATNIFVNSAYTGQVIDENDIAVVRLGQLAPSFAQSYDLYTGPLGGTRLNVAGYGARSDGGGNVGDNLGTGRLRQGDNRYDFAFGDSDFGGFFTNRGSNGYGFFDDVSGDYRAANYANSWVTDFDNGLTANDASCILAGDFGLGGAKYCNLGVGALEVGVAGGDSGGPQFVNGQIASVTSYGLSFGTAFGDVGGGLNSSFGEFSGYVPVFLHTNFIRGALVQGAVPEPSTWAMMIAGFGLVGGSMRIRRRKVSFA